MRQQRPRLVVALGRKSLENTLELCIRVVPDELEAKTHLSRLIEQAAQGQDVVIAKAGKPIVRVVPIDAPAASRPLGFMAGAGCIDLDVKHDFGSDVDEMFAR